MRWRKTEKDFVESARVARLATTDAKRVPHNVPICPLLDNGKLYFGTEAGAKKVRNITVNANVALIFEDYTEAWERLAGIMIQGQARIVRTREFREIRRKIYTKYPQYQSIAPMTDGESAIIEIIPQKKFSWGL